MLTSHSKLELTKKLYDILIHAGFYVSNIHNMRALCFDLIARREQLLLVIKALVNVDAFTHRSAQELRTLAHTLEGIPFLVGLKNSSCKLEDGVVYTRFGVPILSLTTIRDLLVYNIPPLVFSAPGGFYVKLDTNILKNAHLKRNISLGTLAETAGVSRRTIQMYLDGRSAMINVALRLEKLLGERLIVPIDPFTSTRETLDILTEFEELDDFGTKVLSCLYSLGYSVLPACKCPFEAFSRREGTTLLTGLGHTTTERARLVSIISHISKKESVFFVKNKKRSTIVGTPVIDLRDLRGLNTGEEMLNLILERKRAVEQKI